MSPPDPTLSSTLTLSYSHSSSAKQRQRNPFAKAKDFPDKNHPNTVLFYENFPCRSWGWDFFPHLLRLKWHQNHPQDFVKRVNLNLPVPPRQIPASSWVPHPHPSITPGKMEDFIWNGNGVLLCCIKQQPLLVLIYTLSLILVSIPLLKGFSISRCFPIY